MGRNKPLKKAPKNSKIFNSVNIFLVALLLIEMLFIANLALTGNPVRGIVSEADGLNVANLEKTTTTSEPTEKFFAQNLPFSKNPNAISQNVIYSSYDIEYTPCINKRNAEGEIAPCTETEILQRKFVPGEIIIKFKENSGVDSEANAQEYLAGKASQKTAVNSASVTSIQGVKKVISKQITNDIKGLNRIYKIKVNENADVINAVNDYNQDSNIEYAEPNFIAQTFFTPNDPMFSKQWAHQITQAQQGWDIQRGNSNIVIAVLDTGVDYNHEDLSGNIWNNIDEISNNNIDDDNNGFIDDRIGWDFVNLEEFGYASQCTDADCEVEDNNPMDFHGHGTHVSGIVGGYSNNNVGIVGVCHYCNIMAIRAGWDVNGGGALLYEDIAQGIIYATNNGADIISMSFGGGESQAQKDALDYAYSQGVVLIAAAGNGGDNWKSYPAGFENVISVSATDSNDNPAYFTQYGSWVDLASPGVNILSTLPNNQYTSWSGTSMATPYVAGLAGLILSKNPSLTNEQVRTVLRTGVDIPNSDRYIGTGRVNVFKALQINSVPLADIYPEKESWIIRGNKIFNLFGTASGNNFKNYTLEIGQGIYPSSWNVFINSNAEVVNSLITQMNSANYGEGYYSIKLSVNDFNGEKSIDKTILFFDKNLEKEFNNITDYPGALTPTIADLDNNGEKEMVVRNGREVFVINQEGSIDSGWPRNMGCFGGGNTNYAPASVGDLDGDGDKEILITRYSWWGTIDDTNLSCEYCLYAWNKDGTNVSGFPLKCTDFSNDEFAHFAWGPPVLMDLNNDGKKEIIMNYEGEYQIQKPATAIFTYNGQKYGNSPVVYNDFEGFSPIFALGPPSVGDLDCNGDNEIVVEVEGDSNDMGRINYIYILSNTGQILNKFKMPMPTSSWDHTLNLIDVNNDCDKEIIFVASGSALLIDKDGNFLWPPGGYRFIHANLNGKVSSGRFNYQNFASSFVTSTIYQNYLYTYNLSSSGNQLFQSEISGYSFKPVTIFDIDDDGNSEFFTTTSSGLVYGFDNGGNDIQGFPKLTDTYSQSGVIIDDFDQDGVLELIATDFSGKIYIWNLKTSSKNTEWPQYQHDSQHTGLYGYSQNAPTCTDTDGGSNIYAKGTVNAENSSGTYSYTDYCISSSYVKEYYCQGSQVLSSNLYCSKGCLNYNGACTRPTSTGCYIDPKTKKKVCPGSLT